MHEIPFSYIGTHMIAIPVLLGEQPARFILDTGIGVSVVSKSFAESNKLEKSGTFTGKRMSGQEISIDLVSLTELTAGNITRTDIPVGTFDMSGFPEEFSDIMGILSPDFFGDAIFTVDYEKKRVIIRDDIHNIKDLGLEVCDITVEREGPSVTLFLHAELPNDRTVKLEVDTGSGSLILDASFMEELGIRKDGVNTKVFTGTDETGHNYARYFSEISGVVTLKGTNISQKNPGVMFQDIIYDGLIGDDFLSRYNVTYDISNGKMGFSRRQ